MSLIAKLMLLFTLIPIVEIALLVQLHAAIGARWPIAIVCCTAVLGTVLVRWQGKAALQKIKEAIGEGKIPGDEIIDGILVLLAGTTLITPGVLTDTTGLLLLVPVLRAPIRKLIKRRFVKWLGGDVSSSSFMGYGGSVYGDPSAHEGLDEERLPTDSYTNPAQDEEMAEPVRANLGKPDAIL